jgi:hypothetical protein
MPYQKATSTSHTDLYEDVRAFLTNSGGGPGWEELRYTLAPSVGVLRSVLFRASGLSEDQDIHMGLSLHADVGLDTYALGLFMFKAYVPSLADLEQPGISPVVYHSVWNTSIPYTLIANGQRMMLRSKISTTYPACYMGKFLPYGTPSEYPNPYYVGANVALPTTRWSSTSENNRNFFDPGEGAYVLRPDGQWYAVSNFYESSGESEQGNGNFCWPYAGRITNSPRDRYRELRQNIDGTYPLRPIILHGDAPANEILGELDGAFAVTGFGNASENVVNFGGAGHEVVQNVYRTERYYYAALKLE